ncbi:hypothetical protein [Streptomyces sp. URMC 129]|uniref:hypothetical protein n=1 Tax=Streptomyces sp. URMC 129 TaxID=3423407 RepID=UPI003F1D75B6
MAPGWAGRRERSRRARSCRRCRSLVGRPSDALALASVPPILAGLLVPLGAPGADQANFAGYVLWSLWLITLGIGLLRGHPATAPATAPARTPARTGTS